MTPTFPVKVNESVEVINEAYVKNTEDIYYNKDKFESGEINLCFITGHSGSGKTTMGLDMQKDNIEHYQLDDLQCIADHFTMSNLKEYGDLIYSYFSGEGKKFYVTHKYLVNNNIPGSEYEDKLFPGFVHYAMKYANKHKDKKFVLEGVWLFCNGEDGKSWFNPEEFKDYAFYIKGTSMIISKHRGALRDAKEDNNNKKDIIKAYFNNFFRKNWKYYFIDEQRITKFRNYFYNKVNESVVNEVFRGTPMKSDLDPNFIPKDKFYLNDFAKKKIDKVFLNKYKNKYKTLKHVDPKNNGYVWMDDDKVVGYCSVDRDKELPWITALEVTKEYKGHGLGEQLLDYAVNELGGQALTVAKDNMIAKRMYDNYGFKVSKTSQEKADAGESAALFMYLDPSKSYLV